MFNNCRVRWANRLVVGVLGEVAKRKGLKKEDVIKIFVKGKDVEITTGFWDVLDEKAGVRTLETLFVGVNYCKDCRKFHLDEIDSDKTKLHLSEYMKTLPK
jgi:hypothetical protein